MTGMDDVLNERLNTLKADRDRPKAVLERANRVSRKPSGSTQRCLDSSVAACVRTSVSFRKTYLQPLIEVIEVENAQSWIEGRKDLLERAALVRRNNPGS